MKIVDCGKNPEEDTFEREEEDDPSSGSTLKEKWNSSVSSINPDKPVSLSTISNTPLTDRGSPLLFETLFPPPTLRLNSKFEPSSTGQTDKYDKSGEIEGTKEN